STASVRTAVIRTLIEIRPSLRASSETRQAVTVAFVNPAGRGASVYQAMNSSSPRLYTRRVIGDETLSRTSAFSLRHSEVLSATTKAFIQRFGSTSRYGQSFPVASPRGETISFGSSG